MTPGLSPGVAAAAGLTVREVFGRHRRWFGELATDSFGAVNPTT
ncbi:hypothetical protein ACIBD9_18100 [Micromonospora sp. NPDC050784]